MALSSIGPSFLMADPIGPLLDQDEEEALSPSSSFKGRALASPPLSFSSPCLSSSPFSSSSPPPSPPTHPSVLGIKARTDPLSFPWLGASDLLDAHIGADDGIGELPGFLLNAKRAFNKGLKLVNWN